MARKVFRVRGFKVGPGPKATRKGLGSGSIGAGRVARGKGLGFLGGVGTLGGALGAPGPFRLYWGKGVGVHWGGLGL